MLSPIEEPQSKHKWQKSPVYPVTICKIFSSQQSCLDTSDKTRDLQILVDIVVESYGIFILHSKITMTGDAVPYCTFTELVPYTEVAVQLF